MSNSINPPMQTARGLVVEKTVMLEKILTELLKMILDIEDNTKSVSFGDNIQALGLMHKINLLKDLKYASDDVKDHLTAASEIRNKFAHIEEVNSFSYYVKKYPDTKGAKTLKVYSKKITENVSEEIKYSVAFDCLCIGISEWARKTVDEITNNKKLNDKKTYIVEYLRNYFHNSTSEETKKSILQIVENFVNEIPVDKRLIDDIERIKSTI